MFNRLKLELILELKIDINLFKTLLYLI